MIPVPCGAGITKKWKLNICLQEPGRNFQNLRGPEKLAVVRAAHLVEVHSLPALPQLVDNKEMEIWMKLESTEETYKIYPFKFTFETGYCLEGNSLKVIWKVHNNSDGTMYFSLGAHPAFLCPGNSKEGCFINLHTDAGSIESGELTADGVLGNVVRTFPLVDGRLEAKESIFDQDALVVESSGIKKVSLEKPEGEGYLSVLFDTPLLGIWSPAKKQAPFICIEPWYGRCDRAGFEGSLEEREYGNKLETGEVFERSYTIEVEM